MHDPAAIDAGHPCLWVAICEQFCKVCRKESRKDKAIARYVHSPKKREMTDTAEVSTKIPDIEEGSSVSSAQTAGVHGLKVRVNKLRKNLQRQGAHLLDAVVRDLSHGVFVLYRWTADMRHKQRNALATRATV